MYDADIFQPLTELGGIVLPGFVRSNAARGTGSSNECPKSSCVLVLKRISDGAMCLVVAVHLESGPPSETAKVETRACQLHALLAEISSISASLRAGGHTCAILVGGDFNAVREEFVFGNSDVFFDIPAVRAVQPALCRPAAAGHRASPPVPPMAQIHDDGSFRFAYQ